MIYLFFWKSYYPNSLQTKNLKISYEFKCDEISPYITYFILYLYIMHVIFSEDFAYKNNVEKEN